MAILVIIGALCIYYFVKDDKISFEANESEFFKQFADLYKTDEEYEFYSLDAYYLEDIDEVYFNAKYKAYSPAEDKWYDIDEVMYGSLGHFENSYCLSWDQLYGFDSVDKDFKRAQKEGIHKSYSKEEIERLLEEAYNTQ